MRIATKVVTSPQKLLVLVLFRQWNLERRKEKSSGWVKDFDSRGRETKVRSHWKKERSTGVSMANMRKPVIFCCCNLYILPYLLIGSDSWWECVAREMVRGKKNPFKRACGNIYSCFFHL